MYLLSKFHENDSVSSILTKRYALLLGNFGIAN